MTDLSTIRAWLADPTAPNDEACVYVADLLSEIDRLTAERAILSAPVEGVDVEEVLSLYELVTVSSYGYTQPGGKVGQVFHAAPTLAREVQRLRAELDEATRYLTAVDEKLDAANVTTLSATGTMLDAAARVALLAVRSESASTPSEDLYTAQQRLAALAMLASDLCDGVEIAPEDALRQLYLTLAAEQGKAEGAPSKDWKPQGLGIWHNTRTGAAVSRGGWPVTAPGESVWTLPNGTHGISPDARAAMVAADEASAQPDQQPAPERRRPHRSLIHVLDVIDDRVMLSIPGWRSRWFVERTLDVFAPDLRATVARDRYYFGLVNIGAESSDDLAIEVTELAPEPDPADGPDAVEAENAGCPSSLLLTLTPHLKARIEALGYVPGETPAGVLPWLVALAEGQRATLSAPVEGVDVEEVLRLDREGTPGPWEVEMDGDGDEFTSWEWPWRVKGVVNFAEEGKNRHDPTLIVLYRAAAPALAREVQRLRLEVADLRTHHTEALTAAGAPLTDGDGKALSDPQRVAYLSDLVDDGKARHIFQRLVERTAAALGLDKERLDPETGKMCLPSWHDIPEQVECLIKERDAALAEAEELRRAEAAALFLPEGGADLGFLMPEAGLWWKPVDDGSIEIEDFTRCTHPDGKPFRRAHYRNGETLSSSFHATPRAAMRAETP